MHPEILIFVTFTFIALVSAKDFYEMLGVQRNASTKDIKRAYRKMAAIYHPDKNQGDSEAEEKFMELSKAHETLIDDEKRGLYDRFGEAGIGGVRDQSNHFQHHRHHQSFDIHDIFADFDELHRAQHRRRAHHQGFRFNFGNFGGGRNHGEDEEDGTFGHFGFGEFENAGFFKRREPTGKCRTVKQRKGNIILTSTECS